MVALALAPAHRALLDDPELVEAAAVVAAELGDADLESLCDDINAGDTDERVLETILGEDAELRLRVLEARSAQRSRVG